MAVYTVEVTHIPTGVRRSRPIVAQDGEQARQIAEAEWDIEPDDPEASWAVRQNADPDGRTERLLLDAERRRLEAEYYRW